MPKRIVSVYLDEQIMGKINEAGMKTSEAVTWALSMYLDDSTSDTLYLMRIQRMKAELINLMDSVKTWDKLIKNGLQRIEFLKERIEYAQEKHQTDNLKSEETEAMQRLNSLIISHNFDISKVIDDDDADIYMAAIRRFNPEFEIFKHVERLKKLIKQ